MAPALSLVGPPELKDIPQPKPKPASVDPNNPKITRPRPPMGRTENFSATFLTTSNPCLDFFFQLVPSTPTSYINEQLPLAWAHDALTTLKLICNLRGVRGTGKSDKENFYTAAFWLHKNHPKTLACNLPSIASFGYFKDFPEILYRLLEGHDVRKNQKSAWSTKKAAAKMRMQMARLSTRRRGTRLRSRVVAKPKKVRPYNYRNVPREVRVKKAMERAKSEKEKASSARKEKKIAMARKAAARYDRDPDYRFLHERVSDLFAEFLKSDIENLKSKQYKKISLAAKWCPSLDSSFDKATLLCEGIARKVFPRELFPEYEHVEDAHYAYRVRDRLRKEVLVRLRKVLELPEVYMSARKWGLIPYNRVASVAMKNCKDKFLKHDEERFNKYLEDVEAGKDTIAAGALLPHEIIGCLDDKDGGRVAESQWRRMVGDLVKKGKMTNCLAVCDVSGSMSGTPMEVSVALGLLVSELSEEPWKGKVITFSANPQLHLIKGANLQSKCEFVRKMDWGGNTNFQKVFDLLLHVAVNGKLKPEDMIKKVFVFSDMEFDHASANSWETDYESIRRKYKEKGYGDVVPQIVFWNLRHSRSTPVPETQQGVALLSGFSKNLMKLFLDGEVEIGPDLKEEIRPDLIMEAAISREEYQNLVVLD